MNPDHTPLPPFKVTTGKIPQNDHLSLPNADKIEIPFGPYIILKFPNIVPGSKTSRMDSILAEKV